jgi:hypothetical protein
MFNETRNQVIDNLEAGDTVKCVVEGIVEAVTGDDGRTKLVVKAYAGHSAFLSHIYNNDTLKSVEVVKQAARYPLVVGDQIKWASGDSGDSVYAVLEIGKGKVRKLKLVNLATGVVSVSELNSGSPRYISRLNKKPIDWEKTFEIEATPLAVGEEVHYCNNSYQVVYIDKLLEAVVLYNSGGSSYTLGKSYFRTISRKSDQPKIDWVKTFA